jgi:hypothetical protein
MNLDLEVFESRIEHVDVTLHCGQQNRHLAHGGHRTLWNVEHATWSLLLTRLFAIAITDPSPVIGLLLRILTGEGSTLVCARPGFAIWVGREEKHC